MASTVTDGCDTIDTCDPATSVMVEPARSAMLRCTAIGMTRSSVPRTAQLGIVFHAAVSVGPMLAPSAIGRWLATISQRSASGRSWAKEDAMMSELRRVGKECTSGRG